jgi:hypothetical protein
LGAAAAPPPIPLKSCKSGFELAAQHASCLVLDAVCVVVSAHGRRNMRLQHEFAVTVATRR